MVIFKKNITLTDKTVGHLDQHPPATTALVPPTLMTATKPDSGGTHALGEEDFASPQESTPQVNQCETNVDNNGAPAPGASERNTDCAINLQSLLHLENSAPERLRPSGAQKSPATGKRASQVRILPPRRCKRPKQLSAQKEAIKPGRDTVALPIVGKPKPPSKEAGTSMKSPPGAFIASEHTVERVDSVIQNRHTASADSSGDQGAISHSGLAHLDGVLDTTAGVLDPERVTSSNVTPHGRPFMRSSLRQSCYREGHSGEGGTPAVLNPLAPAYHFGPVLTTPDGPEAMVPAKSCDANTGREPGLERPKIEKGLSDLSDRNRGVPPTARGRPSVITGRRPHFESSPGQKGSKRPKCSEPTPQSGVSPGKIFLGPSPAPTNSIVPDSAGKEAERLRFTKALEALGECAMDKHDRLFAKGMTEYGHPRNSSSRCPRHRDSASPNITGPTDKEDWLSASARRAANRLKSVGLPGLIASVRGKADIHPDVGSLPHEAAPLLDQMRRHGAPVKIDGPPLTPKQLAAAIAYGSHNSCDKNPSFLRQEMRDFVEKGFWLVLPLEEALTLEGLRLSPAGLIPQRDRRDRIVIDYTWSGVNDATRRLAPDSMQFGHALQRILQRMYDADPRHGPIYMMKVDIADGFYRVGLTPADVPALGVCLPPGPDGKTLVAFPLVLPMGWVESPPHFCAVTETVADLANTALDAHSPHLRQPHRLDQVSESPAPDLDCPASGHLDINHNRVVESKGALAYIDIFVDDFLGVTQGNKARREEVKRALLHALDDVLRPLSPTDLPTRQDPASLKKMKKGDSTWATQKILLGWVIDSVRGTIHLPQHRVQRLTEMLKEVEGQRRVSRKRWRKLLGELRSMMLAIPGAEGMFSHIQAALVVAGNANRIKVDRSTRDELSDWAWLADDISNRPTSIAEVVRHPPSIWQATDAAKAGMGGVVFDLTKRADPIVWRHPFSVEIQSRWVSDVNPRGDITNSDAELCGLIGGHDVCAQNYDVRHRNITTCCDNTPSVSWSLKGSVSRDSPVAYLLRLLALHRRFYRFVSTVTHIAGDKNLMADDASRLWQLSDTELLAHFNSTYPQDRSWRLVALRPQMHSALISSLCKRRSTEGLFPPVQKQTKVASVSGKSSVGPTTWTPSSIKYGTRCRFSKFLPVGLKAASSLTTGSQYAHVLLRRTSGRLGRRSPTWASSTPVATNTEE